jgi:hypothetical protein
MPQTATNSRAVRHPKMAPPRELVWIEETHFLGWGCSDCAWLFNPSGSPVGDSIREMKENYLRLRDEECAAHVCAEHPRAKKAGIQVIRTAVKSSRGSPRGVWRSSSSYTTKRRAGSRR